jgi:transglutaminase-like putative cysteine protease
MNLRDGLHPLLSLGCFSVRLFKQRGNDQQEPVMEKYIQPTPTMDFTHPAVSGFVEKYAGKEDPPASRAVSLYYAVRDGIRYDPLFH